MVGAKDEATRRRARGALPGLRRGLAPLLGLCLSLRCGVASEVVPQWHGSRVEDLHAEYGRIFRYGNRNAASHLWSTFLLERAPQMTRTRLEELFTGFCAVSGSPVRKSDYRRYLLRLPRAAAVEKDGVEGEPSQAMMPAGNLAGEAGPLEVGFMYYCCWPCVCDTSDFIRVDTKTIATQDGPVRYRFAVIGDPCRFPEKLHETFVQPFDGRETTLAREAPEVRCVNGSLVGAAFSDHGHVIISMFFDPEPTPVEASVALKATHSEALAPSLHAFQHGESSPGRMSAYDSETAGLIYFQDQGEYEPLCTQRASQGYNSGMGEIFRRVAAINPVPAVTRVAASA